MSTAIDIHTTQAADNVLKLGAEANWFQIGNGPQVVLAKRKILRQILTALIDQHLECPGAPMSYEMIATRAWPNQEILPDALGNRVRVAISTLKEFGLDGLIRNRRRRGYFISTQIQVQKLDETELPNSPFTLVA